MEHRKLVRVNEEEAVARAQKCAEDLIDRAGLAKAALNGFEPWVSNYRLT